MLEESPTIKAVLFDLDGVLVEAKDIHKEALNFALSLVAPEYKISEEDHIANYNGKPTKVKLKMLSEKGLDVGLHAEIEGIKQNYTKAFVEKLIKKEDYTGSIECLRKLSEDGYKLGCCTNSIRDTAFLMLELSGHLPYLNLVISNEDVQRNKPYPECWLTACNFWGFGPKEVLIVEDSEVGLRSAIKSGCHYMRVDSNKDVTYENVVKNIAWKNKLNNASCHV